MKPRALTCRCIHAIVLVAIALITPAAGALSFTLTSSQVVHEFTPSWSFTIPGDPPRQFTVAPQATDTVTFDATGISLSADGTTSFEIILTAPAGLLFTINPGLNQWQFGFSLTFSDEGLDAIYANLTVMLLDVSSGTAPELGISAPGGRGSGTTLMGRSFDGPFDVFAFSGLRIAGDITPISAAPITLESASFSFYTRDLSADVDPGDALRIVPIPEPAFGLYCLPVIGLLFKRRKT
jgi:hypothetical protein